MMTNREITRAARAALCGNWLKAAGLTLVRGAVGLFLGAFLGGLLTNGPFHWALYGCDSGVWVQVFQFVFVFGVIGGALACSDPLSGVFALCAFWMGYWGSVYVQSPVIGLPCLLGAVVGIWLAGSLHYGFVRMLWGVSRSEGVRLGNMVYWLRRSHKRRAFRGYWLKVIYLLVCLLPAFAALHGMQLTGPRVPCVGWLFGVLALLAFGLGLWYTYVCVLMPWVLQDEPELSMRAALRKSQYLMRGHLVQMFCLQCRLIVWMVLPFVMIRLAYWLPVDFGVVQMVLLSCVACIFVGALFWLPYYYASVAKFYEAVCNEDREMVK